MTDYTLEQVQEELELRRQQKPSNEFTAFIASLTNDEMARVEYLKKKRFGDQDVVYFKDADNDLAYLDPNTREVKKEFKEYSDYVDAYDIFGKIVPAVQVGTEIAGGILGLEKGYKGDAINIRGVRIPLPFGGRLGAGTLGIAGTGLLGGATYTARQLASMLFSGPDIDTDTLADDLALSSAFSGIPLGISNQAKIIRKFGYAGGDTDLALIMQAANNEGNQNARKLAKERFGIDLTVAEIEYGKSPSRLVTLQNFLIRSKAGHKLNEYYNTTSTQVEEAIDTYLTELQTGKYVTGKKIEGITGQPDTNPVETLKNISENVIKKMASNKQSRYEKLLKEAKSETKRYFFDASGNQVDSIKQAELDDLLLGMDDKTVKAYLKQNQLTSQDKLIEVDVSPIIQKIDEALAQTKSKGLTKTLNDIKKTFYDGNNLKTTLADLDELRKIDLDSLATEGNVKGAYTKAKIPFSYKEDLNILMKNASDKYRLANAVYDPTKAHTQILEKSIVGVLSKVVGDDTKMAKTLQRIFQGNASPREVRAFRRLVQTQDPQAFQNLKHMFLSDEIATAKNMPQFIRKVGFGNLNPKYMQALDLKYTANAEYNTAVKEFGLNSREANIKGNAKRIADDGFADAQKYLDKRKKVYQALLEPEEFETFVSLMDTVQKASFIKNMSASDTFQFGSIQDDITKQLVGRTGRVVDATLQILNILTPTTGRTAFKKSVSDQGESLMIDMLISSPENTKAVEEAIRIVNPYLYAYGVQLPTRTTDFLTKEEDLPQADVEEGDVITRDNLSSQLDSALQNMQQSDIPLVPPATSVTPEAMLSETILPNPDDREIAQRMMGARGIGSLMS